MTDEPLPLEGLRAWSKTRLAETVRAQAAMLILVQQEKAEVEWQAGLLAAQRDAVVKYMEGVNGLPGYFLLRYFNEIYQILITDPRDTP